MQGKGRTVGSAGCSLLFSWRNKNTDLGVQQAWAPAPPLSPWPCASSKLFHFGSSCASAVNQDSGLCSGISCAWACANPSTGISTNVNWLSFSYKCQKKPMKLMTALVTHLTANKELGRPYVWYNQRKYNYHTFFTKQWHFRYLVILCRLLRGGRALDPLKRSKSFSAWPIWERCPSPVYSITCCIIEPYAPHIVW